MDTLTRQQRRFFVFLIAILLTGLTLKVVDRNRRAMDIDIQWLLDGYRHSSEVRADTSRASNVVLSAPLGDSATAAAKPAETTSVKTTAEEQDLAPAIKKINVNKASQAELEALPGIGPVLAARIIAYRDSVGLFANPRDLLAVKGIGPKKLAKIIGHIEF